MHINCYVNDTGKHFSNGVLRYPSVPWAIDGGSIGYHISTSTESLCLYLVSMLASIEALSSIKSFIALKSVETLGRQ